MERDVDVNRRTDDVLRYNNRPFHRGGIGIGGSIDRVDDRYLRGMSLGSETAPS